MGGKKVGKKRGKERNMFYIDRPFISALDGNQISISSVRHEALCDQENGFAGREEKFGLSG